MHLAQLIDFTDAIQCRQQNLVQVPPIQQRCVLQHTFCHHCVHLPPTSGHCQTAKHLFVCGTCHLHVYLAQHSNEYYVVWPACIKPQLVETRTPMPDKAAGTCSSNAFTSQDKKCAPE